MAQVNFPSSPTDGQIHTSPAGQKWKWNAAKGLWLSFGTAQALATQIVDAGIGATSGWQVSGDMMVQWGEGTVPANSDITPLNLVFQKVFKGAVSVIATTVAEDNGFPLSTFNITTTGCEIRAFRATDGSVPPFNVGIRWVAFGEALDADKQPKEVAAGVANTDAFHDPTRVASWRLDRVTKTLECWGVNETGDAGPAVTQLPKTFANIDYTLTLTPHVNAGTVRTVQEHTGVPNRQVDSFAVRRFSNSGAENTSSFNWRVIGEWDGVS